MNYTSSKIATWFSKYNKKNALHSCDIPPRTHNFTIIIYVIQRKFFVPIAIINLLDFDSNWLSCNALL